MFAVLQPLHAKMEKGEETLKETSFNQVAIVRTSLIIQVALHTHMHKLYAWCGKYGLHLIILIAIDFWGIIANLL